MELPKKITPCPILAAHIEIRFETSVPPDAVFGVLYSQFQNEYKSFDSLPILQLPEQVRMTDVNLKYQPFYRKAKDNIVLNIGPRVVNISCENEYMGWDNLFSVITSHFDKIRDARFISKVTRFGLRYINYFDHDIFTNIKLNIDADNIPFKKNQTLIKTQVEHKKYDIMLHIANNATVNKNKKIMHGSILDIDVSISNPKFDILHAISKIVTEAHDEEKILFFSLLKEEFLAQLNPVY